jgi:uncharacterized protein (DUF736 family)
MANPAINASLFKNERKDSPNQPDFTGPGSVTPDNLKALYEAALGGQAVFDDNGSIKVRVAGWKKESASGKTYISLSIQLEQPKPAASAPAVKSDDSLF